MLLKALQGNSTEALAPSRKPVIGNALLDGVSMFVGAVPRAAEDDALLAVFPRGAQIEHRFRGGQGKFGFLRLLCPVLKVTHPRYFVLTHPSYSVLTHKSIPY